MGSLPAGPEQNPTAASSGAVRVSRLKRDLVAGLHLQAGSFWEAVQAIRSEWNIAPRKILPSKVDHGTYYPVEQAPPGKWGRARIKFNGRWDDALRSLVTRFVPALLVRAGWDDFFGACVMCDPPDGRLWEFAEFGRIYPSPFWPPFECEPDEIDTSKLHYMVAPPIERVWREPTGEYYEDGEQFAEYRIIVDEYTTKEDVIHAFRGIKAAYDMRNSGGRPPIDKLAAIQCAVLYDDYNGADPEDGRFRRWTYKKLAAEFRGLGVKNERSAEEHVKRGRELRKKFRNP